MPEVYFFPLSVQTRFQPMSDALLAAKEERDILFELCLYGWGNVEEWGPGAGHLWRTGYDAV